MQTQERGGCLTAWLVVALIANAGVAFYYITSSSALQRAFPSASSAVFLLLAGLGILNVVAAIGLWTWHKWGFYLFAASSVIGLLINFYLGIPILSSVSGLIGLAILWFLIRNKWAAFA